MTAIPAEARDAAIDAAQATGGMWRGGSDRGYYGGMVDAALAAAGPHIAAHARTEVVGHAAAYVEQMAADHEGAAVHLLASPHRAGGVARDEAQVRDGVAKNLRYLATWLRSLVAAVPDPTGDPDA